MGMTVEVEVAYLWVDPRLQKTNSVVANGLDETNLQRNLSTRRKVIRIDDDTKVPPSLYTSHHHLST